MDHTTYKGKLWGKLHVVWGHFLLWKDVEAHTSHPQLKVSAQKIMSKVGELGSPEHNWCSPLPCKIQRPANSEWLCQESQGQESHCLVLGRYRHWRHKCLYLNDTPFNSLKWWVYLWHQQCGRSMWCFRSRQQWWLEVFYTSPFFLPSLISRSSQLTVPLCFPFHFLRVSYDDTYGVEDIWALSVILCGLAHQEDSKLKPDNILLVN